MLFFNGYLIQTGCAIRTVEQQKKSKSIQLRQKHQLMLFLPAQVIQLKMVWDKLRPESLHIQERYHTGKKEDVTLLHLGETINIATCPEILKCFVRICRRYM